MRRNVLAAATLGIISLLPLFTRAETTYNLVLTGSRCASAVSRADGVFASAWVCSGVQIARGGIELPDPERLQTPAQSSFACIAIADFKAGTVQRACGPVADGALSGDPALQEGKIDFFLTQGDRVLAARITLTGMGPYLNDHLLSEFGNGTSSPEHSAEIYGVARIYRMAKLSGFIRGQGIKTSVRGSRASMSTGVSGVAQIQDNTESAT